MHPKSWFAIVRIITSLSSSPSGCRFTKQCSRPSCPNISPPYICGMPHAVQQPSST